jgi:transcription elongation factor Elf1
MVILGTELRLNIEQSSTGQLPTFFSCPHCSEQVSVVLDTSVKRQIYIEDCEVCCCPIKIRYAVADDDVCEFEARAI